MFYFLGCKHMWKLPNIHLEIRKEEAKQHDLFGVVSQSHLNPLHEEQSRGHKKVAANV